ASRRSRRGHRSRTRTPRRRKRRRQTAAALRTGCWPAAAASPACSRTLLLFLGGGLRRREVLALVRRQRLVFGPLLAQLAALLGRHLGDALVVLARLAALHGGQLGPNLHAPLHALLLLRLHLGVALGDTDPFAPALGLEALPIRLERRESVLLLDGQLGPRRPAALVFGYLSPGRACSDAQREDKQCAAHYSSAARVF